MGCLPLHAPKVLLNFFSTKQRPTYLWSLQTVTQLQLSQFFYSRCLWHSPSSPKWDSVEDWPDSALGRNCDALGLDQNFRRLILEQVIHEQLGDEDLLLPIKILRPVLTTWVCPKGLSLGPGAKLSPRGKVWPQRRSFPLGVNTHAFINPPGVNTLFSEGRAEDLHPQGHPGHKVYTWRPNITPVITFRPYIGAKLKPASEDNWSFSISRDEM
jgi:hypothetical protein